MKKRIKMQFNCKFLAIIIPEAKDLDIVPRKRKKQLKKFIAEKLIEIANNEAMRLESMLALNLNVNEVN
jgi:hypothetical protein